MTDVAELQRNAARKAVCKLLATWNSLLQRGTSELSKRLVPEQGRTVVHTS